jgi:hypothetical protein
MMSDVGLWIDHRKAVIVTVAGEMEETKSIEKNRLPSCLRIWM